jgi:Kef-type K+ transport system membrane component KefB
VGAGIQSPAPTFAPNSASEPDGEQLLTHSLQVLLLLALIIAAAKIAGALAARIHQPAVFGEILAGVILGPTVLNILGWPMFAPPLEASATGSLPLLAVVRDLAQVGVLLLMFVAGLETDLDQMRHVGRVAFWSAFGGVVLPFIGGAALASAFGLPLFWEGIYIGTILTATSVSISAQTLMELGALRSREGSTILAAAVIDDVMGIVVLSIVVALSKASLSGVDGGALAIVALRLVVYFAVAIYAGRWLPNVLRWASDLPASQAMLAAVLVVAFVYGWAAEYVGGVAAITGTYLSGVLVGRTRFKASIDAGVHALTYAMFVPVFFISIGLQADARALAEQVPFATGLILVAIVTKAIGCGVASRLCGFDQRESIRVGIGMISRGEVGLIVAGYGLAEGLIGRDVFSASVLVVLATTMATPPLLRLVFPRHDMGHIVVEETIAGPPPEPQLE